MAKKNLSQIAKRVVAPPVAKKVVPVINEVAAVKSEITVLTTDEREQITKKTVEDLLSEVNVNQVGKVDEESQVKVQAESEEYTDSVSQEVEWLTEQIARLNQENDELKSQINGNITNENINLGDTAYVVENTITLYNKIQEIYDNLKRINGDLIIYPKPFLIELENYFPYLKQYRRRLLDE